MPRPPASRPIQQTTGSDVPYRASRGQAQTDEEARGRGHRRASAGRSTGTLADEATFCFLSRRARRRGQNHQMIRRRIVRWLTSFITRGGGVAYSWNLVKGKMPQFIRIMEICTTMWYSRIY